MENLEFARELMVFILLSGLGLILLGALATAVWRLITDG